MWVITFYLGAFPFLLFAVGGGGKNFFFPLVITKIISHSQMGSFNASKNKVQGSSRVQKGDWHLTLHLKKKKKKKAHPRSREEESPEFIRGKRKSKDTKLWNYLLNNKNTGKRKDRPFSWLTSFTEHFAKRWESLRFWKDLFKQKA